MCMNLGAYIWITRSPKDAHNFLVKLLEHPNSPFPCRLLRGEKAHTFHREPPLWYLVKCMGKDKNISPQCPSGVDSLVSGCPARDIAFTVTGSHLNPVGPWSLQTEHKAILPYNHTTVHISSTQGLHANTIEHFPSDNNTVLFSEAGTRYNKEEECGRNPHNHTGWRKSRPGWWKCPFSLSLLRACSFPKAGHRFVLVTELFSDVSMRSKFTHFLIL